MLYSHSTLTKEAFKEIIKRPKLSWHDKPMMSVYKLLTTTVFEGHKILYLTIITNFLGVKIFCFGVVQDLVAQVTLKRKRTESVRLNSNKFWKNCSAVSQEIKKRHSSSSPKQCQPRTTSKKHKLKLLEWLSQPPDLENLWVDFKHALPAKQTEVSQNCLW